MNYHSRYAREKVIVAIFPGYRVTNIDCCTPSLSACINLHVGGCGYNLMCCSVHVDNNVYYPVYFVCPCRQLCLLLNAEDIYSCCSEILIGEDDILFASHMIQTLSTILLTSSELFELRTQLKELNTEVGVITAAMAATKAASEA